MGGFFLIRDQWYAVLESVEVPRGKPVGVTRLGEKLVFWRDADGSVVCMKDRCCHRGAALSLGEFCGGHLACPFHGFQYDKSGRVVRIPANGINTPVPDRYHVSTYPAAEVGGLVFIWRGEAKQDLPPVPFFEELLDFSYDTMKDPWPVHYSRAVENQLDVVHLPFVHYNTIGRGGRMLVNGPAVVWEGDRMTFYVDNQSDDGKTVPKKPEEITNLGELFHLKFQMPNMWQNMISDKVRIFAAFVPVDEENTLVYLRFYQRFMRTPGIRRIVNKMGNRFNRVVLHQDRDVVITQQPVRSDLKMDENLIQGDRPIVEYRKRREALRQKAGQL
jgi:phenylpropionate dioxygenase-like ring-hydroxylating dioxygenase large terminal subunit